MENGRQMRITEPEMALIKATFKENEPLLKLLRKIFLPEIDPNAPIGQVVDLWMTIPPAELTPEQAYINLKARNSIIAHVEQQLQQLSTLANQEVLSPIQLAEKNRKDSSK